MLLCLVRVLDLLDIIHNQSSTDFTLCDAVQKVSIFIVFILEM